MIVEGRGGLGGGFTDARHLVVEGAEAGAFASATSAMADAKFSQSMAKYQPTPKGAASCKTCSLFEGPDACRVVSGTISASGWCLLFAPKS